MKFYKILILIGILNTSLHADITHEFPSYNYVFNELDVNTNYIYNPDFQNFVQRNKETFKKRFITAVQRGQLIIPTMKELMYKKDISPMFIYLSMTESAFKTEAKSTSSAGGLWQFIKTTGEEQKLQINHIIDERYDPIKSTDAAIDYLYKIRDGLDKWYLAAMAYNCGQGCVKRAVIKAGTKDLTRLIDPQREYLPAETRKYIKKILLFAMIGENYLFRSNDNLGQMIYKFNRDSLTPVRVHGGEKLGHIASILNMNYSILKRTNMHLKQDYVPYNSNVKINIPTSRLNMFYSRYRGGYALNHKVQQRGDRILLGQNNYR